MAVKEVVVRTRPNTSVPFCRAKDVGLPVDHEAVAHDGVISFDITYSEDGLTRTTTTTFRDEEARTSYNDNDVFKSAMRALKQQDEGNNITKTVTITEV
tara:strand:- start:10 stop:306 length:297 start_codon:yes stop_codon:yes gene_type:complete